MGSLFSGIGGIDLGLERAGMEIAWQVEIDDYCRRVLAKHWPDVPKYGDICECGAHNLAAIDVLAGGFPCQPVSHAGKRKAQNDARWLWPEFHRIVCELRPRYVFVENVPGLLDGPIGEVLGDLAASGYDAEWDCIPAAAFGAPHERDRVWLVAYAQCARWEGFVSDARIFGSAAEARSFNGHSPFRGWPTVVADRRRDRGSNGVRLSVERRRLQGLGNAVVPQIVEWIGRRIMSAEGGIIGGTR